MLIDPSKADNLKLEIWREMYRARPTIYPGGLGGAGQQIPVPDAIACARNAQAVFDTLYPVATTLTITKSAKKRARK